MEARSLVGSVSGVCLASLLLIYCTCCPLIRLLDIWWAKLMVYASLPIGVTFIFLYRSSWHTEIIGSARTLCLIPFAFAVFAGVLLVIRLATAIAAFFAIALGSLEVQRDRATIVSKTNRLTNCISDFD